MPRILTTDGGITHAFRIGVARVVVRRMNASDGAALINGAWNAIAACVGSADRCIEVFVPNASAFVDRAGAHSQREQERHPHSTAQTELPQLHVRGILHARQICAARQNCAEISPVLKRRGSVRVPSMQKALSLISTMSFALTLAACGGGDSGNMPAGDTCTSDGTPAGDCAKFNCEVMHASAALCPGQTTLNFECTGIESFPASYQMDVQDYFESCAPTLDTYMETTVETTQGPATISPCEILGCAIIPNSRREVGPMTIMAACAPVPTACSFPNPPS